MSKQITALENKLIAGGIDITAEEFLRAQAEAQQHAAEAIEKPEPPAELRMPENYERLSQNITAFGRLGVLLQVMFIQGGLAPIMNVLLIAVDTYRLWAVIAAFEPGWLAASLLALGVMAAYTYLSLQKADLKYALRKNMVYQFSLRTWVENFLYSIGWGDDWKPRQLSQTEMQYKRVKTMAFYFKLSLLILLILHSLAVVAEGNAVTGGLENAKASEVLDALGGALGGVIVTMILIITLDMQIERGYALYMQTGGAAVASQDFFAAQLERYSVQVQEARDTALLNFLKTKYMQMEAARQLPPPSEPTQQS